MGFNSVVMQLFAIFVLVLALPQTAEAARALESKSSSSSKASKSKGSKTRSKSSAGIIPTASPTASPTAISTASPTALPTQGPEACPEDLKQCPDGSFVGRDPNNNCEFFPCPTTSPAATPPCMKDAFFCPDDTVVGRDPNNNCEFFPCPTSLPTSSPTMSPTARPSVEPSGGPSASPSATIGYFIQNGGNLGHSYPSEQTTPLINWLRGDPEESFAHDQDLLTHQACEKLRFFIDSNDYRAATSSTDCSTCKIEYHVDTKHETKFGISAHELQSLIGTEGAQNLREFFAKHTGNAPVTSINLRRLEANNQYVPFHLDVHSYVLQVPLNNEDEYEGGKLVILNENGTFYPSRQVGSATLHDASRLVHGVSKLTSGYRYSLYLLNDPTLPQECVLERALHAAVGTNNTEEDWCEDTLTTI